MKYNWSKGFVGEDLQPTFWQKLKFWILHPVKAWNCNKITKIECGEELTDEELLQLEEEVLAHYEENELPTAYLNERLWLIKNKD